MSSKKHFKVFFNSLRVKKIQPNPRQPDYYNIIKINDKYFTLTGWLEGITSNIKFSLEIINEERLGSDSYLRKDYANFLRKNRNK